jgi:hypothetical protein
MALNPDTGNPGVGSALYATLFGTQVHTLNAITDALNANQEFADAIMKHLDTKALADALNDALDPNNSQFLVQNLANLDAAGINRINNSVGLTLVKQLLGLNPASLSSLPAQGPLHGDTVAQALKGGLEPLLEGLLGQLSGKETALLSEANKASGVTPLLQQMLVDNKGLADVLASSIQNSANTGGGLLRNLGLRVHAVTTIPLLGIPAGLDIDAFIIGAWANSWPDPPADWPLGP